MTPAEARTLESGDRICLKPQPMWVTNPPACMTFTVAMVDFRAGYSDVAHRLGGGGSCRGGGQRAMSVAIAVASPHAPRLSCAAMHAMGRAETKHGEQGTYDCL